MRGNLLIWILSTCVSIIVILAILNALGLEIDVAEFLKSGYDSFVSLVKSLL